MPDVLAANSGPAVAALARQTQTIPIVVASVLDPVGAGVVASLAKPGGNITGFSAVEPAITGKWLELLKDIVPDLRRVAVIFNPDAGPLAPLYLHSVETAGALFSVEATGISVHETSDIERAISSVAQERGSGLIVLPDVFTISHRKQIIALTAKHRLPTIYALRYFATDGGLLSYGPSPLGLFRQVGSYVDRILKGEDPANLPVQGPTKFELVINLKTAKALGLDVPLFLQQRADAVIE